MICYKDKAFCIHTDCCVVECDRHLSKVDEEKAKRLRLDISYSDFKDSVECIGFEREFRCGCKSTVGLYCEMHGCEAIRK